MEVEDPAIREIMSDIVQEIVGQGEAL